MATYKLFPECKDYLWGGEKLKKYYGKKTDKSPCAESWELSFHKDGLTKISNGKTLKDVVSNKDLGENSKDFPFFPVLIKFIDAEQNLSVQVHPSDEYAIKNENSFGKTEMWYIVDAVDGAGIYCGFKENIDKDVFLKKIQDGTVEDLLNFIPVKKGDCFFIEAGTVHAIGKGCLICEIQQNSNLTYRVYDYNRRGADGKLRELHIDKAVKVINFNKFTPKTFESCNEKNSKLLADCKYFRVKELKINGEYQIVNNDSFSAISVVSGCGNINGIEVKKGDSLFISCGDKIIMNGKFTMLITDIHKKKYYAGIDLGGTFIKCGIVDENGNILIKDKIPTGKDRDYHEVVNDMANFVLSLEKKANVTVSNIGIGSPGTINSKDGIVEYSNNISWKKVPLAPLLKTLTNKNVKITNDANAAALGEYSLIKNKYSSMVFLTLGTGLGSGIIIDGKLFEGYKSAGAEVGHGLLKLGGEKCTCGRKGCCEAYTSATALIRQTKKAMEKNKDSLLWKVANGSLDNVNGKTVFDAMLLQDKTAKKVFNTYIKYLSEMVLNVANIFRPEIILIGGGISAQGDIIIKPLRKRVFKNIFGGTKYAPIKIETATLQNDAGLIGAAELCK